MITIEDMVREIVAASTQDCIQELVWEMILVDVQKACFWVGGKSYRALA